MTENKSFQIINRKNAQEGTAKVVSLSFNEESIELKISPKEIVEISCPNGASMTFEFKNELMSISARSKYCNFGPFNTKRMSNSQIEGITVNF